MLNIVIYENNGSFITKNISSINLALSNYDIDYRIHKFKDYSDELDSIVKSSDCRKIYILNAETGDVSGIEVARRIRKYDWDSIIIMVAGSGKLKNDIFNVKLMILDYIFRIDEYEKRLVDDIKIAFSIIDKSRVWAFKYNHVIHLIPYDHICYIEKEQAIKRCIVHTINEKYYVTSSINCILSQLNGNFCRTHQSCIINLNNVRKIDLSSNKIIFKNGESTDMLTTRMKKEVKKYYRVS